MPNNAPANTPAHNDIIWHGTDRRCETSIDDDHKGKYLVRVVFSKYGYDGNTMERVQETTDTYVVATNLSYKAAKAMKEQLELVTDHTFGQGYNYARNG